MERETGIEPALVAWKATVLPLNYSRSGILHSQNLPTVLLQKSGGGRWITPGILPSALACSLILWWREVDSNHRRHEPADLQSAPVGRLGIPPALSNFQNLLHKSRWRWVTPGILPFALRAISPREMFKIVSRRSRLTTEGMSQQIYSRPRWPHSISPRSRLFSGSATTLVKESF